MTGQQTLEDVGVKRARTESDNNDGIEGKDSQPESKKAHSTKSEQKPARPSSSKENEGSNAQTAAKPTEKTNANADTKNEKQNGQAAKNPSEHKGQECKEEAQPEQGAKAVADPKATVPASVPKPEGVVEEGRIYFLYRPRVNIDHPTSIDDIQRFFMILAPTSREKAPFRLLIIGKKRLPTAEGHERFFGFVEATADSMEKLTGDLGEVGNQSATRGYRTTEPARICGEGIYEIVDRGGRRTSFAYKLEIPKEPGEVQKELQIRQEASYTLSIKNPGAGDPPNAGLQDKADYKASQKKQFGGYRWIGCSDPSLLDMQRCEFLFIGARGGEDIKEALGDAAVHLEKAAEEDLDNYMDKVAPEGANEQTAMLAKLRDETHAAQAGLPTDAAATGKWQ